MCMFQGISSAGLTRTVPVGPFATMSKNRFRRESLGCREFGLYVPLGLFSWLLTGAAAAATVVLYLNLEVAAA